MAKKRNKTKICSGIIMFRLKPKNNPFLPWGKKLSVVNLRPIKPWSTSYADLLIN